MTLYVASIDGPVTVQSISTITNQAGKPIRTGDYDSGATEAITPDRKTLYVADFKAQAVIPISTATGQVGPPVKVERVLRPWRSRRTGGPSMSSTSGPAR